MGYYSIKKTLFPSGDLLLSPGILDRSFDYFGFLTRHLTGDWGDVAESDVLENNRAIIQGDELLSQYETQDRSGIPVTIVIMTPGDRSYTVIFVLGEPDFG